MLARLRLMSAVQVSLFLILFACSASAQQQIPIPEQAEIMFANATAAYIRGDFKEAAEDFARLYYTYPEMRQALYWEGIASSAAKDYARAEARLAQYILGEPSPESSPVYFDLAVVFIGQERWPEALQSLEIASRSAEPRAEIDYFRGLCLVHLGDTREARRALDRALSATPYLEDRIYSLLAACDLIDGDRKAALSNIEQALTVTEDEELQEELTRATDVISDVEGWSSWVAGMVRIGAAYDSNPTRISSEAEDVSPESGRSDLTAQLLFLPLHRADARQWIGYRFDSRFHFGYDDDEEPSAGDFDLMRHRALIGGSAGFMAGSVGIRPSLGYGFSYVLLGGETYEFQHRADPALRVYETRNLATELAYSFLYDDYDEFDGADSMSHRAQLSQYIMFWEGRAQASLGGGGELKQADADSLDRTSWWVLAGISAPIVYDIRINTTYTYRTDLYSNHPLDRNDVRHRLSLGIGREFLDQLTLEGRIIWQSHVGDPEIYSYSRTVGGLWLEWDFL